MSRTFENQHYIPPKAILLNGSLQLVQLLFD